MKNYSEHFSLLAHKEVHYLAKNHVTNLPNNNNNAATLTAAAVAETAAKKAAIMQTQEEVAANRGKAAAAVEWSVSRHGNCSKYKISRIARMRRTPSFQRLNEARPASGHGCRS